MSSAEDSGQELDLSEIDIFSSKPRKRKSERKPVSLCGTDYGSVSNKPTPTAVRSEFQERLAVASLEAGSLHKRNIGARRRSEQRYRARMKRRQQALSSAAEEGGLGQQPLKEDQQKWEQVRPFLTVNDHLSSAVPHGSCGPKTELESLVDAAIAEGDFEKAEMLSDHLANRQFAVKIADAFAAKRCAEEQQARRRRDYVKRQTKLPWGFEAKERWQMKGNM